MAKYSDEFKLKIVKEYLSGKFSYRKLANKYGMVASTQVIEWVRAYKEFGSEGIQKKQIKQVHPVQFKLTVLNFMKRTGASYRDTMIEFKMNNPSVIANWHRKFLDEGVEGLKEKKKGRPPMTKDKNTNSNNKERIVSREEELERENELLRLEITYLKKLRAFQENPDAYLEKHKQRWHSKLKKKDSD